MEQAKSPPPGAALPASAAPRAPAWLDAAQGASGLVLALFMWAHMLLVSSILLGHDAMYTVARFFEGQYLFGRPYPQLVSGLALGIFLLLALHALIALRRLPASYREYRDLWRHSRSLRHPDTWLWMMQVVTGLGLMFLAPIHLYAMFSHPGEIGPYASGDRFVTGGMWPLYLVLLFAVELHGGIGLYRLVIKWGLLPGSADPRRYRRRLSRAKWGLTGFFLALGLMTFIAYFKIGLEHRAHAGERYQPAAQRTIAPTDMR